MFKNLTAGAHLSLAHLTEPVRAEKEKNGGEGVAVAGVLTVGVSWRPQRQGGEGVEAGRLGEAGCSSLAWLRVPGRSGAATALSTEEAGGGRG